MTYTMRPSQVASPGPLQQSKCEPMNPRDQIDLAHLQTALAGTRFGGKLQHFPSLASTNTHLLAAAAAGAPDGTVFLADAQTAGRGRGSHRWHSDPGDGIYLSALVRSPIPIADALLLSLATGLAVQYAVLEATGLELDIRWPNDLLLNDGPAHSNDSSESNESSESNGSSGFHNERRLNHPKPGNQKKCGGVLVETAVEPAPHSRLRYAVIGIGLNVHQPSFPPELATLATSLHIADRARRDDPEDFVPLFRAPIILAILRRLDTELQELERRAAKGRVSLLQRFTASSSWVCDKRVSVPEQGGYTGTTAGLDDRGFLIVHADDGSLRTVLSGGVRAL